MARESPADKIARLKRAVEAWERMRPGRSFHGLTLAQFKRAIQPSFRARADISDLRRQLRVKIIGRDMADGLSLETLQGVVFSVMGDPAEGQDGEFYGALGYVRKSARRKRRRSTRAPKKRSGR